MQFDLNKLKKEQLELAKKVVVKDDFEKLETIGGIDQAYVEDKIISCIVVCNYDTMKVVEKKTAVSEATVPYIPGYLSYREAPVMVKVFQSLKTKPDVLIVDSNGILHPRRIGCASHVGLLLDQPTIGVAKKLLLGEIKEDSVVIDDEVRAKLMKTREFAKPIFISPGHRVSLKRSVEIVKHCVREGHKLPEPVHLAHKFANKLKRAEKNKGSSD